MKRFALIAMLAALAGFPPPAAADRTQAEQSVSEGDGLLQRRDFDGAIAAYTRAIEADRSWGVPWGKRGYAKRIATRFNASLEDFTLAISLEPDVSEWRLQRAQAYLNLDRNTEALEDGEVFVKKWPQDPTAYVLLGWALARTGDVDRGLEMQTKGLQLSGGNANLRVRFETFQMKADWKACLEEMDAALAGGNPSLGIYVNRVIALVEMKEFDRAVEALNLAGSKSKGTVYYSAKVYLTSTPAAGAHYNAEQALKDAKAMSEGTTQSDVMNAWARALFLTGHVQECLELLATKGRRTNWETLFWLGASYWKKGQFPEARAVLQDARRLNPYLLQHADRVEGFRDFCASIDKELASEAGGPQGVDRARLGHELATHLLTVAEIETLVRRYQFARAVTEYEKLLPSLKSAVRKSEVETRLPEVRGMAGAHLKLVSAVNKGGEKLKTKVGKTDLTLVKANDTAFDFTLAGGDGKFPWAFLDTLVYCELAQKQALTPDEMFGLGCLAWDAGQRPAAVKLLDEATKKKAALKSNLASFVARRRGLAVPAGGFVLFRGSYVTVEEKTNLEKGLVNFEGLWVTSKDKDMLSKGYIQVSGKWVPGEEAELLKRGFRKYKDKWMSREDYEALRGGWDDAYSEETAHYVVRTNHKESFAKDLAGLMEAAYEDYRRFYGGDEPKLPGKEKMTLYAFKTYDDYRKYCVETKAEDHLNAAGFARSDSNVVVGWNKTNNDQQFLQTMVHEGAHLFFFRVQPSARPQSWYAEGMATYFEGFAWDGRTYKFNHVSESRLPFVRDAMKGDRHIPLEALLGGDALSLINSDSTKALLFYAECWALNYYLSETDNRGYREAYLQYRKAVAAGKADPLLGFFKDPAQLEKDWVQFVTGL
ncbi:MAG: tetratricopeptide repeat protein [Planctomycetes bacterium]|nr:tetratricopeptide repeat protein [Planctomycetota bacterium]